MPHSFRIATKITMGKKMLYLVSLPERLPRAAAAGVGGVLYESSLVLLPEWARGSQLYQALLGRMLRITVEWAGGMPVVTPADPRKSRTEFNKLQKRLRRNVARAIDDFRMIESEMVPVIIPNIPNVFSTTWSG